MTKRLEFPRKVKDQAFARANGKCENKKCGLPLQIGRFHFDHILPDALGGQPTLPNCQVLCEPCHVAKTAKEDVPRIRKADRQRAAHLGIKSPSSRPIASRGFAKAEKQPRNGAVKIDKRALPTLPRRNPVTREIIK